MIEIYDHETGFTTERVTPLVDERLGDCPVCKSLDVQGESFDMFEATVEQNVDCMECASSWTDRYVSDQHPTMLAEALNDLLEREIKRNNWLMYKSGISKEKVLSSSTYDTNNDFYMQLHLGLSNFIKLMSEKKGE
tara:strand:+ start:582 stop:989 length:408 start_codon:yes stop_codon:yes gene_type:complete